MVVSTKNPWGIPGGLEAQRADLWHLDFTPLIYLVQNPAGVSMTTEYSKLASLSEGFDPNQYVIRVTPPDEMINGVSIMAGSSFRYLPAMDAPPGAMRVDFYHEAIPQLEQSAAYCMLAAWQRLASAGQQTEAGTYLYLIDGASKPSYRVDLPLIYLQGSVNGDTLDTAASYMARNCWLADLQFNSIDQAGTALQEMSATIYTSGLQLIPRVDLT